MKRSPGLQIRVARFWNEDGVEMPSLWWDQDEQKAFCTWNWKDAAVIHAAQVRVSIIRRDLYDVASRQRWR